MLGEPDEIEPQPVEPRHLIHDRRIERLMAQARFRRIAEIVGGAQTQRLGHRRFLPSLALNIAATKPTFPAVPSQQDAQRWISSRQQPNTLLSGKSVFMPASITVSRLAWSTPDGRPVLSNLDLSFGSGRTGLVGRNGVGKNTLLKLIADD